MGTIAGKAPTEMHVVAIDFDAFYESEYRGLTRIAYALTGSRGVAEDLVQETMLRAYRHWSSVSHYDRPGAWAWRVLMNLASSRGKRLGVEARALVRLRGDRPVEPVPTSETMELWAAVRRLPARQAQAITLHYLEDCSVQQIADALGCAQGTVKSLLHRGRHTLATMLGEDLDEDEEDGE